MTEPNHPPDDLEQLLDEAGRYCRPRDPRWETLLDRLPPQASAEPRPRPPERPVRARWWRDLSVAAAMLLAATCFVFFWLGSPGGSPEVSAKWYPIEVHRTSLGLTIFTASTRREPTLMSAGGQATVSSLSGLALVKDQRLVMHLKNGDNTVRFTDVAATIDPTSVRLVSTTAPTQTRVVEQNFEYDLANSDGILQRSLEREIHCLDLAGAELASGYLLSFDDQQLVLAAEPATPKSADEKSGAGGNRKRRPKTQTIRRSRIQAIRIPELPPDLHTRPTLVWKVRTTRLGDHTMLLSTGSGVANPLSHPPTDIHRPNGMLPLRELLGPR